MTLTLEQLAKDLINVDLDNILHCWQWRLAEMKAVVTISCMGDMFLLGQDDNIYWLQTDTGNLSKIASSFEQYQQFLGNEENIDNWFLPLLVEKLIIAGKTLKENEVYSYKKLPVIGGEYIVDNIDPTDMSVHFAFTGQICEQIKDLPDGTKIKIKFEK
jgi:hypothetical protein